MARKTPETLRSYRWFGTPEAPFGWYYDLLALWAHVSTASVWVRLPTLVMALACDQTRVFNMASSSGGTPET